MIETTAMVQVEARPQQLRSHDHQRQPQDIKCHAHDHHRLEPQEPLSSRLQYLQPLQQKPKPKQQKQQKQQPQPQQQHIKQDDQEKSSLVCKVVVSDLRRINERELSPMGAYFLALATTLHCTDYQIVADSAKPGSTPLSFFPGSFSFLKESVSTASLSSLILQSQQDISQMESSAKSSRRWVSDSSSVSSHNSGTSGSMGSSAVSDSRLSVPQRNVSTTKLPQVTASRARSDRLIPPLQPPKSPLPPPPPPASSSDWEFSYGDKSSPSSFKQKGDRKNCSTARQRSLITMPKQRLPKLITSPNNSLSERKSNSSSMRRSSAGHNDDNDDDDDDYDDDYDDDIVSDCEQMLQLYRSKQRQREAVEETSSSSSATAASLSSSKPPSPPSRNRSIKGDALLDPNHYSLPPHPRQTSSSSSSSSSALKNGMKRASSYGNELHLANQSSSRSSSSLSAAVDAPPSYSRSSETTSPRSPSRRSPSSPNNDKIKSRSHQGSNARFHSSADADDDSLPSQRRKRNSLSKYQQTSTSMPSLLLQKPKRNGSVHSRGTGRNTSTSSNYVMTLPTIPQSPVPLPPPPPPPIPGGAGLPTDDVMGKKLIEAIEKLSVRAALALSRPMIVNQPEETNAPKEVDTCNDGDHDDDDDDNNESGDDKFDVQHLNSSFSSINSNSRSTPGKVLPYRARRRFSDASIDDSSIYAAGGGGQEGSIEINSNVMNVIDKLSVRAALALSDRTTPEAEYDNSSCHNSDYHAASDVEMLSD